MKVFRHGDTISSEIPSDWAEQLGEPLSEADIALIVRNQLEFSFLKEIRNLRVSDRAEQCSWEDIMRKVSSLDPSEEAE